MNYVNLLGKDESLKYYINNFIKFKIQNDMTIYEETGNVAFTLATLGMRDVIRVQYELLLATVIRLSIAIVLMKQFFLARSKK